MSTCTAFSADGPCARTAKDPGGQTVETTDLCVEHLYRDLEWTLHSAAEDVAAAMRQANAADRWLPANLTRALHAAHVALQAWEAEQELVERRAS